MPLSDLIAALASATGPSRELDERMAVELFGWRVEKVHGAAWFAHDADHQWYVDPPRYTASLDAITVALEQRWPGVVRTAMQHGLPETMRSIDIVEPCAYWWRPKSPPLALCLAAARLALAEGGR
jgi:hypothetical protein